MRRRRPTGIWLRRLSVMMIALGFVDLIGFILLAKSPMMTVLMSLGLVLIPLGYVGWLAGHVVYALAFIDREPVDAEH
jgi:hypothetical protein